MRPAICLALAVGLTLAACDSDGDSAADDTPVEDTAEPERTGGPTTIADVAPAVDADDVPDGGWVVGEFICEPPPDDADEFDLVADFASPAQVAAGSTITVALDAALVTAALELDEGTEVASYGGDHVVLACWSDGGWTPVWVVRLPGFVPIEDDDEDGDVVDGADADAGSYPLGPEVAITGTDIVEPFTVEAQVPAEIPPGQYRWLKTIGVGDGERFVIVQPVEITG